MEIILVKQDLDMQHSDIEVNRYRNEDKDIWNAFITKSKNSIFLFDRNYMDYHSDRFDDHSLIILRKGSIVALFPANQSEKKIISHQGLTYGGILLLQESTLVEVIEMMKQIALYYKAMSFHSIIYKCIPYIYHKIPSSEDLYALSLLQASFVRRNASAVIDLNHKIAYAKGRKSQISKARKFDLRIEKSEDFNGFMNLVGDRLREKYDAKSTHTENEISYLASIFPDNIKLYLCKKNDEIHSGIIIFETETTAHCQYISTSSFGRDIGALDLLTDYLITNIYSSKLYFNFGTSAEFNEIGINLGLHKNKESYGARTIICDTYEIGLC